MVKKTRLNFFKKWQCDKILVHLKEFGPKIKLEGFLVAIAPHKIITLWTLNTIIKKDHFFPLIKFFEALQNVEAFLH